MTPLLQSLKPCGPVVAAAAAARAREALGDAPAVEAAWPALAPIFAAAPYLARLATRDPAGLAGLLEADPDAGLAALLAQTKACASLAPDAASAALRRLKARAHLLCALCDLGGVWGLDAVTGALTAFADEAVRAALAVTAGAAEADGRLQSGARRAAGPLPGFFVIAMGKMGAFELNYSSDIDISLFYEPTALPLAEGVEPHLFATRFAQSVASLLQERTGEGYVFRVDLRLRPDPASTPPAMPVEAALDYYQTVGQNWERAAMIKARIAAGDIPRGEAFLEQLQPFVWRRNLDFAAISDIHSIKRQIRDLRPDERLAAPGADLKLGPGGIREIEFFVQTQQLILGGRHPSLRARRTLDALAALAREGQASEAAAAELAEAYRTLRALEHRTQMIADEQTHRLPAREGERRAVAALFGYRDLRRFDAAVVRILKTVASYYGALFAGEEPLSSRFGSLVFTGVEDDPETLRTLKRMGFADPARVAAAVRAWHHGRIAATRTERGRELFTRLAPLLLDAAAATGAPDVAFDRFADFFASLSAGVQVQSLFLAKPQLLEFVVRVMALAPRLARALARQPAALEALLDPGFFAPFEPLGPPPPPLRGAQGFEAAMDAARRLHRERALQIGLRVLAGARSEEAGAAFADLADVCIRGLAQAALAEVERQAGAFPGELAVIALGRCGSREMTANSDLDLMTLYAPHRADAVSGVKGWAAETYFARVTGRLITALSAPTAEGRLYEVDMRLRPSGAAGPVAVSFAAFETYYECQAETWEFQALTRARVAWATSEGFAARVEHAIEAALRAPRGPRATAGDVLAMRRLLAKEKPAAGFWDLKQSEGALVDIEFAAQALQLAHAAAGGPLRPHTPDALQALADGGWAPAEPLEDLRLAWRLQQDLAQLLNVALPYGGDPEAEPKALKALLVKAGGARDWRNLKAELTRRRKAAHRAFRTLLAATGDGTGPPAR